MFPEFLPTPWLRLLISLALETVLVVAAASLLACRAHSATGQRTIWRLSFVALAVVLLAEFSGLGHRAVQGLRALPAPAPQERMAVTSVVVADVSPALMAAPPETGLPTVSLKPHRSIPVWPWLVLALAGLLWLGVRRSVGVVWIIRLRRHSQQDNGVLSTRAQALARRLGLRRRVRVQPFARLAGPMAFGVLRPVIGVPADFASSHNEAQQDAMLAHELAHVAAFDALWLFGVDLLVALLWWHPLAWWARRRLRSVTEAAADESSLLVDNGPAVLAECLVALGRKLARAPMLGGLGMAEHRFRSELGRRVERLLALRGREWRPRRGAIAWLTRILAPIALTALALAAAAWLLPREGRAATLSEVFQRSPLGLAATALLTADENDAPRLILQGKKLYDTGRTNEAEGKWRSALELDPGNAVARDYLKQLGRTNFPAPSLRPPSAAVPAPALEPRTNNVGTSKARQKIHDKLDGIVMGPVRFENLPLSEVISAIVLEARIRDPERRGVDIGLPEALTSAAPFVDPATGLPVAGHPAGQPELDPAVVRIVPAIEGLTLRQLLDVIVKVASRRLYYTVEDWGVLFTDTPTPTLHTRWFRVQTNDFFRNLGVRPQPPGTMRSLGARTDLLPYTGQRSGQGISMGNTATPQDQMTAQIISHFGLAGVDLRSPKAITFNDRLGLLMVRATLQDLDLIEQNVQVLNTAPPQVVIEVKFCELPEDGTAGLGLDLFLGSFPTNAPAAKHSADGSSPGPTDRRNAVTNVARQGITGILTPQQYAVVLRALEQRAGASILAAPTVLTPNGRQAQIKTVQVKTVVTGLDLSTNLPPEPGQPPAHPPISESFELGPVVDVVPYVAADGQTIQLTVIPSIKEFLGYDLDPPADLWDYVESPGANPAPPRPALSPTQIYPLPVFRLRQVVTSASVWDGQTFVLSMGKAKLIVPDGHPAQKLPAEIFDRITSKLADTKKNPRKALLVFITPTIVDRAGNRVHTDLDLPARTLSVPPQHPPTAK